MSHSSIKIGKLPKISLANGMCFGKVTTNLPKFTIIEEALIEKYHCHVILIKLWYTSKLIIEQHALKGNLVSFPHDPTCGVNSMDKKLPTTLEAFSNVVVVHFLGNKHLDLNMIKHCELPYLIEN